MKRLLIYCLAMTSIPSLASQELYNQFSIFFTDFNQQDYKNQYTLFFSNQFVNRTNIDDIVITEQIFLKDKISKLTHHDEIIFNKSGCLKLDAVDDKNQAFTLYLGYIKEKKAWKINDINYHSENPNPLLPPKPDCYHKPGSP